tara:strand:- start:1412 stop:2134 length:723 start_codon:yes stop_codon:yes gene_type:complete
MNTFIEKYENALSNKHCDYIVDLIEKNPQLTYEGRTGGGKKLKVKKSTDIDLYNFPESKVINEEILPSIFKSLKNNVISYCKKNSVTAPWPNAEGLFGDLNKSNEEYWDRINEYIVFDNVFSLCKKYNKNDGFFNWHLDTGTVVNNRWRLFSRAIVCMFYLNDVKEGGETGFYYQDIEIKPSKGTLVIFPAGFTHLHRGKQPVSNNKYIANFWFLNRNPAVIHELSQYNTHVEAKKIFKL